MYNILYAAIGAIGAWPRVVELVEGILAVLHLAEHVELLLFGVHRDCRRDDVRPQMGGCSQQQGEASGRSLLCDVRISFFSVLDVLHIPQYERLSFISAKLVVHNTITPLL